MSRKLAKKTYIILLLLNDEILAIFRNAVCPVNSRHVCENCLLGDSMHYNIVHDIIPLSHRYMDARVRNELNCIMIYVSHVGTGNAIFVINNPFVENEHVISSELLART